MLDRNGAIFWTNHEELKAFLGSNYLMGINMLLSVANYREVDHKIWNDGIKNVVTWQRFQDILQNLHFSNNNCDDKSDKSRDLYVMVGNIYNIVPSKLTSLLAKIYYGKNPHFRHSSVNIFHVCHMMT